MLDATKQKKRKLRIERPFDQFGAIATLRNEVVHWGASSDLCGNFIISNYDRKPLKPKLYQINIEHLKHACADLLKISLFIQFELGEIDVPVEKVDAYMREAWQYKPPQLSAQRQAQDIRRAK
ncbi:hypothetical protein [Methylocystis iwaonis]|uniref:Uncharacterized protein n=1 Tax=Methylocystis iwaonis TaxID=2885079 RepID=A0ABN6VKN8_9HYPH|nr:hypothetical protein [Methylocystis iwaonis]BDV35682.1 hypothetical protein SS37A_32110 [Methylocystis iwaonis]